MPNLTATSDSWGSSTWRLKDFGLWGTGYLKCVCLPTCMELSRMCLSSAKSEQGFHWKCTIWSLKDFFSVAGTIQNALKHGPCQNSKQLKSPSNTIWSEDLFLFWSEIDIAFSPANPCFCEIKYWKPWKLMDRLSLWISLLARKPTNADTGELPKASSWPELLAGHSPLPQDVRSVLLPKGWSRKSLAWPHKLNSRFIPTIVLLSKKQPEATQTSGCPVGASSKKSVGYCSRDSCKLVWNIFVSWNAHKESENAQPYLRMRLWNSDNNREQIWKTPNHERNTAKDDASHKFLALTCPAAIIRPVHCEVKIESKINFSPCRKNTRKCVLLSCKGQKPWWIL